MGKKFSNFPWMFDKDTGGLYKCLDCGRPWGTNMNCEYCLEIRRYNEMSERNPKKEHEE